jgi:hypothetical protein
MSTMFFMPWVQVMAKYIRRQAKVEMSKLINVKLMVTINDGDLWHCIAENGEQYTFPKHFNVQVMDFVHVGHAIHISAKQLSQEYELAGSEKLKYIKNFIDEIDV